VTVALPQTTNAQLFGAKSLLIKNARIQDGTGRTMDGMDVMIRGKQIARIGKGLKGQMFTPVVDAEGMTLTPGLIDAWSALGRIDESEKTAAYSTSWDTFDRYDDQLLRQALAQGVTTIYLAPGGGAGVRGHGAVIDLKPAGKHSVGELVDDQGAIAIHLGSDKTPLQRLRMFSKIRGAFRKASEYGEAKDLYEEELEEYLEKLEERRKENEKENGKDGDKAKDAKEKKADGKKKDGKKAGKKKGKKDDKPKPDKPAPEEPKPDKPKPEPKPEDKARAYDANHLQQADSTRAALMPANEEGDFNRREKRKGRGGGKGKKKGKKKDSDKKDGEEEEEDELKKPERPAPDRESEEILKAINKEVAVRVTAHRSADILNALELADEYGLDLILVGATDAALVAHEIANADVPVILGPVIRNMSFENDEYRRHSMRTAGVLEEHGVTYVIGSGSNFGLSGRFIGQHAQMAAGRNPEVDHWLPLATSRPASILGLEKRGRVAPRMRADLVLWTGDPGDPDATVHRVYIDGEIAWEAPKKAKAGGS
ncbi:MAG: amidohydrolase family protein, partial [Phycisphaerae bacterium]